VSRRLDIEVSPEKELAANYANYANIRVISVIGGKVFLIPHKVTLKIMHELDLIDQ